MTSFNSSLNSTRSTLDSSQLDLQTIKSAFSYYENGEREREEERRGGEIEREGEREYVPPPVIPSVTPLPTPSSSVSSSSKRYNNNNDFNNNNNNQIVNSKEKEPVHNPFDEPVPENSNETENENEDDGNPFTEKYDDAKNPFSPKSNAPPQQLENSRIPSPVNGKDQTTTPLLGEKAEKIEDEFDML